MIELWVKMSTYKVLKKFSDKIRLRRHELCLSQEKAAELIGCHPNTFKRVESAKANPSVLMVIKIAKALKISVRDLFEKY